MPIRVLPENVAAQIAAGEVVERPVSVIKELIENSLDAGASQIDVEIEGSGVDLLRVTDNGEGIPPDEVLLAVERHATSKLLQFEDLYNIHTLGFRGEALASIAAVSHFRLSSRHVGEKIGVDLLIHGGIVQHQQSIGMPVGTMLEIRNLFYNVPARRKFLKSETTERRHVANLITNYAMAYPEVRFSMHSGGREAFRTAGSGKLGDVIIDTLGLDVFREMIEVQPLPNAGQRADLPPISVSGFVTNPYHTRANRSQIILFINGRQVQDQRLSYGVVQAYHGLIEGGRYPVAVLMIELPPSEMDVNVHPTKAEVRFRSPDAVFSAVQRSVRKALLELQEDMEVPGPSSYGQHSRPYDAPAEPYSSIHSGAGGRGASPNSRVVDPQQLGIDLDAAEGKRQVDALDPRFQAESDDAFVEHIPATATAPRRPRNLPMMRVVGQVGASYIVAEGPAGMYLVDQHAAHERILYELLAQAYDTHEKPPQHRLEAAVVELPAAESRALESYLPQLKRLGFELELFGVNTFRVQQMPAMVADHEPGDVLHRVLHQLDTQDLEKALLRRVSKLGAVKAGQVLSLDEMQSLLRQLEHCQQPRECPLGRPTMLHMSTADLAREFGKD